MATVLGGWRRAAFGCVCALFVCLFPSLTPGAATPDDVTYHYDALGRLTRVVHTGQNIEYVYEYDAAGNRTRVLVTGTGAPTLRLEPAPGSVPPFSAVEGGTIDLTVALSVAAATDVTVTLSTTADGIAGALAGPDDYTSLSQTVTIPAGQTQSTPVQIVTAPDALPDGDEVFGLRLSDPVGAVLDPARSSVTATILEGTAAFTVTDINPIEPAVRAFTVVRAGDLSGTDTVAYSVTGGTAVLGTDFDVVASAGDMTVQPASGTLTFAEGVASQQIFIRTYDEGGVEPDETFFLDLSAPSAGARIAGARGTGTLRDNSVLPVINVFNAFVPAEGAAGTTTTVDVTVFFQGGVTEDAGFYIETADGTATAPADYVALPRRWVAVTPAPGETVFESVETITIQGDDITEPRETFQVIVSDPVGLRTVTGGVSPDNPDKGSNGTVTIDNDDAGGVTVAINNAPAVAEGGNMVFPVTLSGAYAQDITVGYEIIYESTTPSRTSASADDIVVPAVLQTVIAAGETAGSIVLPVRPDAVFEWWDQLQVRLTAVSAGTIAPASDRATGDIMEASTPPSFSINDVSAPESQDLIFTVTRTGQTERRHDITYTVVAGSAQPGDFTATEGTVIIRPTTTTATITVPVTDDTLVEGDETVRVLLTGDARGGTFTDSEGVGTIVNDDITVPAISIGDAAPVDEGDTGAGAVLSFGIALSEPTTVPVGVTCRAESSTANLPRAEAHDVVGGLPLDIPVTFAPGTTTATCGVPIVADTAYEVDDRVTVTLVGPSGATLAPGADSAVGIIRNDDAKPVFRIDNPVPVGVMEGDGPPSPVLTYTIVKQGETRLSHSVTATTVANPGGTPADPANTWATAAIDYVQRVNAPVSFLPHETSKPFSVTVLPDTVVETDEVVRVEIAPGDAHTVVAAAATGYTAAGIIRNDDITVPAISIGDAAPVDEGDTGAGAALSFGIALSEPTTVPVGVTCRAESSTANLPRAEAHDVVGGLPLDIPVTFAPGTTTATCGVPIVADTAYEVDDRVTVTLVGPSGATLAPGAGSAVGIIRNDDAKPVFRIDNPVPVGVMEGDGPPNPVLTYTIVRQGETRLSHSVTATTVANPGGTPADPANTWATAAVDYVQRNNAPVSFLPHETSKPFSVTVLPDTVVETDEVVRVEIAPGDVHTDVAAAATGYTAAGIIRNDDEAPPHVQFITSDPDVRMSNNNLSYTINSVDFNSTHWVRANKGIGSQKGYFEVTINRTESNWIHFGMVHQDGGLQDQFYTSSSANSDPGPLYILRRGADDRRRVEELKSAPGGPNPGTVIGFAWDGQARTLTVSYNGQFWHTFTGIRAGTYFPTFTGRAPMQATFNFGMTAFRHAIPNGFLSYEEAVNGASGGGGSSGGGSGSLPVIKISNGGILEGGPVVPTIWLTKVAQQPVTFNLRYTNVTASSNDYTPRTGPFTIPAGQSHPTVPINIPTIEDTVVEGDETFTIELVNVSGATPDPVQYRATGTIRNDDSDGGSSGGGSSGAVQFITSDSAVQMSGGNLTYTMTGSTENWIRANKSIGSQKGYFEVTINQTESNWIHFGMIHQDGGLQDLIYTGTSSGGSGPLNMLRRSADGGVAERRNAPGRPNPATVIGFAWDGQARTLAVSYNGQFWHTFTGIRAGTYFPTFTGRAPMGATFNFGATAFRHAIPNGFLPYEEAVGGASGGGSSGGGSGSLPVIKISNGGILEGGPVVPTIWLTKVAQQPVTFNLRYTNVTASSNDYTPRTGPFTIPAGQSHPTVPVNIPTIEDTVVEADETFTIELINVSGATPDPVQYRATGTIRNDDSDGGSSGGGSSGGGSSSTCPTTMDDAFLSQGESLTCTCSAADASNHGNIWGTDIYGGFSDLCSSAVHAGKITTGGGQITFIHTGVRFSFTGSTRNGVTTRSVSQNPQPSYEFQ